MADDNGSQVLKGDKIFFSKGHFDDLSERELTKAVTELGGGIAADQDDATVVLINPGSPLYRPVTDASSSQPSSRISYHWLAQCRIRQRRLDAADLDPARPFMQHASHTKVGMPVPIYVSKNVYRSPVQLDVPVWKIVGDQLAGAGAIIVAKRSEADVLVVDRRSDFYKNTIKPEIQKFKRTHQRVAERAWVEQCMALNQFLGISVGDMEEEDARHQREDSFADEGEAPAAPKKKPGRPVGKPRTEYTPEDDEFLCRYLAAFYPGGAHGSRKTYEMMAEREHEFRIVERHTYQSWHERFKKNATVFERRVQRYIAEGIDYELRTESDRKKEREKRAQRAAAADAEAEPSGLQQDGADTRPPPPARGPTSADKGKGRVVPAKRALADLSSDEDEPQKSPKKGPSVVGRTSRIEALGEAPAVVTQPTTLTTSMNGKNGAPSRRPAAAAAAPAYPRPGPHVLFQPDNDVFSIVRPQPEAPAQAAAAAVVEMTVVETTVVETSIATASNATSANGAAEAVVSEPERAPQPGVPSASTPQRRFPAPSTPSTPAAAPGPSTAPQTAPPAATTPHQPRQTGVPSTAPQPSRPIPQTPQTPLAPAAAVAQTPEAPSGQRLRTPQTTPRVAAVPTPTPAVAPPPASSPAPLVPPAAGPPSTAEADSDSSSWRQEMQRQIEAVRLRKQTQADKPRRSIETITRDTGAARQAPATVSVEAPAEVPTPAAAAPTPAAAAAAALDKPRPPTEILSPAQHAERVAAGKEQVKQTQETYRQRILAYTAKYNLRPAELMATVSEITRGIKTGNHWETVDQRLRQKFGY